TLTEEKYGKNKISYDYLLQDWGITYDELEPYFYKFEETAGISGEDNPKGAPRKNDYPTPPMKSTPILDRFKKAAKNLDLHPFQMPSANLSEQYENPDGETIQACQYCGFCERFGCEYGAKSTPNVTVIPTAEKTGKEFEQPADVVVLTSYTLNNTRLLLHSEIGEPYNPDTGEGVIGRNYCYQILAGATGFFEDEKFNTFMGAGALGATVDDFNG